MALTGSVAGDTRWASLKESVLLYEGSVTPTTMEDGYGNERPAVIRSAPIAEGDLVELYDDSEFEYSNLDDGLPVVRPLSGTGAKYVARIIDIEKARKQVPATAVSALADLISGGWMRLATVEFIGMSGRALIEATIAANTPADVIPVGDATKLVWDVSAKKFTFGTGTNNELVPLTRLTGATGADVTGAVLCGIGLKRLQLVA